MALPKYLPELAKELQKFYESSITKPEAPTEVLELVVIELRRRYDKICHDYDVSRLKVLTLLGGGLAFLSFLYAGKTKSGQADIFFPSSLDDRIFYFIGLGLVIGALCILFWAIRPSDWALPLDAKRLARIEEGHNTKDKFLAYIRDEYLESTTFCMNQLARMVTLLNVSINMLFIGAIILLVLKYFGG